LPELRAKDLWIEEDTQALGRLMPTERVGEGNEQALGFQGRGEARLTCQLAQDLESGSGKREQLCCHGDLL
jgi:hypothetical protein